MCSAASHYSYTKMPIYLYSSEQVYDIEQAWFARGYDSFGLMQQAAWQMTQQIIKRHESAHTQSKTKRKSLRLNSYPRACIWVGQGNNGGDGWLIARYLQQAGWQVQVITVGIDNIEDKTAKNQTSGTASDAKKAQQIALDAQCPYQRFEDSWDDKDNETHLHTIWQADVFIDALFGIGLDRAPEGVYKQAIKAFNKAAYQTDALTIAVDIPSGLVASTGQVFEGVAVQANITLCLIARKFGLHTKDGQDYTGQIIDIPLIPYETIKPIGLLLNKAYHMSARQRNSYKGSYGHVLIIGGNRIEGSQGMGGAAILSSASAMAVGAGKITVACHDAFHGALLTSLPDAMTIDLHDQKGVNSLIKEASVVAIGMGLGRDEKAKALFIDYVQTAIEQKCALVIDADGLYHLASLHVDDHKLIAQLREYSAIYQVCLTPHSGEAARLLDQNSSEVESDRLSAIKQCAKTYGGSWVLKGTGSLVMEQDKVYVCNAGNAGMASAGMGDVLSGVIAGLLAQQDLETAQRSLHQAVMIHGLAGDVLVKMPAQKIQASSLLHPSLHSSLLVGERGLQAQDMPAAIRHVIQKLTQ